MREVAIFLFFALACMVPINASGVPRPPDSAPTSPVAPANSCTSPWAFSTVPIQSAFAAPPSRTPVLDPRELESFVELERQWDAAMSAMPKDRGQALLKLLTDDVAIIICGEPPLLGKEAVRRHYDGPYNRHAALSIVSNIEQAEISGQLALVRGTYTFRATWRPGYTSGVYTSGLEWGSGFTTLGEGSFIDVLRRRDDGSWKFALSAWNATSREYECPDPVWTFRGYSLGMPKEDALAILPARQEENTKVRSWGGELWSAELPGEYEIRIYLSPSDKVIAFSVFHEVAAKTLFDETNEHWGGFTLSTHRKVHVSGHARIRKDYMMHHPHCDAAVLLTAIHDVHDTEFDDPRMLNIMVWSKEFLTYTVKRRKREMWQLPLQLWKPPRNFK